MLDAPNLNQYSSPLLKKPVHNSPQESQPKSPFDIRKPWQDTPKPVPPGMQGG